MNKTKIEWVKNPDGTQGFTWNPITGCLNGCEYCYARRLANTRLKDVYLANRNIAPLLPLNQGGELYGYEKPFYPRFWEDNYRKGAYELSVSTKARGVFVCSMSDLFGIGVPEEWTWKVLYEIAHSSHRNRYYLLTKQPQNLAKFSPFPDNCWVGATVTDQDMFDESMLHLTSIRARKKYISFEPLLDPIIPGTWISPDGELHYRDSMPGDAWNDWFLHIDWIIIGSQTKPYKPPKIEWVDEIVKAADQAGIPVFLKNNLTPLEFAKARLLTKTDGGWALRQEMP